MRTKAAKLLSRKITWRSHKPSRLETFSDAVFGFALTLMIVSIGVGFVAIYGFFYLMYRNATKYADEIGLSPVGLFETKTVAGINMPLCYTDYLVCSGRLRRQNPVYLLPDNRYHILFDIVPL